MTIEAGKYYKMRNGGKAFVTGTFANPFDPERLNRFPVRGVIELGVRWQAWTEEGRYRIDSQSHPYDLIEPWTESLTFEAGKFYLTRSGKRAFVSAVALPMPEGFYHDINPICGSILGVGGNCWTVRGFSSWDESESPNDLVAPWTDEETTLDIIVVKDGNGVYGCFIVGRDNCSPVGAATIVKQLTVTV